jgi:hypothetical protein
LQVQRWEGGEWLSFPLPTKTDQSGQFTAFVELGQPGRYRLRVLDPDSGVRSKTFVLVIRGCPGLLISCEGSVTAFSLAMAATLSRYLVWLRRRYAISESKPWCKYGMVYKLGQH